MCMHIVLLFIQVLKGGNENQEWLLRQLASQISGKFQPIGVGDFSFAFGYMYLVMIELAIKSIMFICAHFICS